MRLILIYKIGRKHHHVNHQVLFYLHNSYLIYLVQIQNMEKFKIAKDIDANYYKNYLIAKKAGVNFLAYRCNIDSKKIFIEKKLNIINE